MKAEKDPFLWKVTDFQRWADSAATDGDKAFYKALAGTCTYSFADARQWV